MMWEFNTEEIYDIDFIVCYDLKTAHGNKRFQFSRKLYSDDFVQCLTPKDYADFQQGNIKDYHWPAYEYLCKKIHKWSKIFINGYNLKFFDFEILLTVEFDYGDIEEFSLKYAYVPDTLKFIKGLIPEKLGYCNNG